MPRRIWRYAAIGLLILVLACFYGASFRKEQNACMGVRILTEAELRDYQTYVYRDFSHRLTHQEKTAAIDTGRDTIYIAQNIGENTRYRDLSGRLLLSGSNYDLAFAPDPYWEKLAIAVEENHKFRLLISVAEGSYMAYDVVFTTMPVLRMEGQWQEDAQEYSGEICLWMPDAGDGRTYLTRTSDLKWHVRGGSTSSTLKRSWKLGLKNKEGQNQNVNFLNLGADDDWILNPLVMDDTKMRERIFQDLWNALAEQSMHNEPMSTGEYVEAVINGSYQGLYYLQRRVDAKYLALSAEDVLLKGSQDQNTDIFGLAYETVASPLEETALLGLMDQYFADGGASLLETSNYVDVSLFLQFFASLDNRNNKNMFFLLRESEDGYKMTLIPWDTDMSMGLTWSADYGFCYDYVSCISMNVERREMPVMRQQVPLLDYILKTRWQELKQGVLSCEAIAGRMEEYQEQLMSSGALTRDRNKWGQRWDGSDTVENLLRFAKERTLWMDEYYAN